VHIIFIGAYYLLGAYFLPGTWHHLLSAYTLSRGSSNRINNYWCEKD